MVGFLEGGGFVGRVFEFDHGQGQAVDKEAEIQGQAGLVGDVQGGAEQVVGRRQPLTPVLAGQEREA